MRAAILYSGHPTKNERGPVSFVKMKIGIYIICALLILALIGGVIVNITGKKPETDFVTVAAPEQTAPIIPAWAAAKERIVPVTGDNLALSKVISCNEYTDVYQARNANDGDDKTYWEGASNKYPNELTVDLGKPASVKCVQIRLNPLNLWEARKQTFSILGSSDGNNYSSIVQSKEYDFDPASGNILIVRFDPVTTRFVRLEFTANTAANAGQVAEFEIY